MDSDASDDEYSKHKRLKHRDNDHRDNHRRYNDNKSYKLEIYKSRRRSLEKELTHCHSSHHSKARHSHKHHRRDEKDDERSSSESSMSADSYRKHNKKDSRLKRSRSLTDAKHYKYSKKQHKEKKNKYSKEDSRISKSSTSLINEIAMNVLKFNKDSYNNSNLSPPLPPNKIFTFNPPLPPPEEKKEKVQEPSIKKMSVLDLPMPPILISKPTTNAPILMPKLEVLPPIKHVPNWDNSKEHKEEMKNHLQKNSVILTPGYGLAPEPIRRSRSQQELKRNEFKNSSEQDYGIMKQIGEGTFGKVYKAMHIGSGKVVAMKLIRMENEQQGFPITSLREIKILKVLKHPNIVELVDVVFTQGKNKTYLIFEFMNHDLLGLIKTWK